MVARRSSYEADAAALRKVADAARLLHQQSVPWFQLSIVPFGIAFLRYALLSAAAA